MTLDIALSQAYSSHVLRGVPMSQAVDHLKAYIETEEGKTEARQKLGELSKLDLSTGGRLKNRCYVSHIQKMALEEVLNG